MTVEAWMRAFSEDPGDILAVKLVCLALGVGFVLGGIAQTVSGDPMLGLPLMLIGCYVCAACAVGLRDGKDGWAVFAPAGASALMAIVGLSLATGTVMV